MGSIILDGLSSVNEGAFDLNQRIARRVRELRAARRSSLDGLATRSGVSRSMISLIERGETSATAVVLERIATALGVVLADLFEVPVSVNQGPVALRVNQTVWRDPESGYSRRNLSPSGLSQPMQLVEVHFPAGGRVAFESGDRGARVYQQVWIIKGAMEITVGGTRHRLGEGDCLGMELDKPTLFYNPTKKATRYLVVLARETFSKKR